MSVKLSSKQKVGWKVAWKITAGWTTGVIGASGYFIPLFFHLLFVVSNYPDF